MNAPSIPEIITEWAKDRKAELPLLMADQNRINAAAKKSREA